MGPGSLGSFFVCGILTHVCVCERERERESLFKCWNLVWMEGCGLGNASSQVS